MSGESIVLKVINKINTEIKLVYSKNKVLTQELCRMLYNGLFQLHFDYACPAWYPNLNKEKKMEYTNYTKNVYTVLSEIRVYLLRSLDR